MVAVVVVVVVVIVAVAVVVVVVVVILCGFNTCAAEGVAEQQHMVESIHTMIGDLEVEKQSFLTTMNSQQVQCLQNTLYACVNHETAAILCRKLMGAWLCQ